MVGLVVVSHSSKAAEGICEIAAEMGGEDASIVPAGGTEDGRVGTSADLIRAAIEEAGQSGPVVVLVDLGSAVMNAELAIEMGDVEAVIADAPVLEGALNAAATAAGSKATLESVREAAENAAGVSKT
ncbi:dihydroxyacetone kinase subunit M [Halalkalicoccus paucihalophilus]|jgi:phosphoenolpyruvate---glycerone phosphotransferase subunit DhaM|uniref:phosphoenolpyruvate--glycerone phosphotransferase n=1 Tax=Halalkalicoccus paucihalophilus TaxID=1008153 RepID=A0A151AC98_9EURY|nr:dihydroxyacetone kinase phosphoryl donor subunit DhaM [Halalkalicoccus paucihalophilus]KYH25321.1 dihydroxyacetone kinase subunit M [Halalkalicoccus paucihalophilus]